MEYVGPESVSLSALKPRTTVLYKEKRRSAVQMQHTSSKLFYLDECVLSGWNLQSGCRGILSETTLSV